MGNDGKSVICSDMAAQKQLQLRNVTVFLSELFDIVPGSISVALSYRDVELLMAERGNVDCFETIRRWCLKIGEVYS